jgi:hypothetical protein
LPAAADAIADFYSGKQISLIIGYGTGGGYDLYLACSPASSATRGHPKHGLSAKLLAGQRHVCPYCRQQKRTRWWFTRARLCSVMA